MTDPKPETDLFATGMVHFKEQHQDLTPELDRFHFQLIRPFLGRRLLELGAGAGRVTDLVQRQHDYDHFLVSEPSVHFFEQLRTRYQGNPCVQLKQAISTELLPEHANEFDTVFSIHVMEHIKDDRAFVRDSLALLFPKGRLIIMVPAIQALYSDLDRQIGHFRRYDKKMIRKLVEGLDAEIESIKYSNFLGILASFVVLKLGRLNYQQEKKASKFFWLYGVYSRYFIPVIQTLEKILPVPVGLNLTVVLRKRALQ